MTQRLQEKCEIQTLSSRSILRSVQPTAVGLIRAIQTVPLSITEHTCRQAATLVVTVVSTAPRVLQTVQLIRTVLTLRYIITHLVLAYTLLPVGTLELVCLDIGNIIKRQSCGFDFSR